tara:strand:- start:1767 stop:2873 length:1107 start_codon:yes stop_codon:yes gene_type:complete
MDLFRFLFVSFSLFFSNCFTQCEDVTLASITNPGPYLVSQLVEGIDGIRNGPDYDGATIYYPINAVPPFTGIAIVPGYCGVEMDIQNWGPFYASHGIIAITVGTNDPCADWPAVRAVALLDAIETIKSENTRDGSPLNGKVDVNSFAVSGWSMGGGGAQLAASLDSSLKAVVGLCPWLDLNDFEDSDLFHNVPVIIFTGQNDDIASSADYGYMHYTNTPINTDKLYFEIENGGHGAANAPGMAGGEIGIYALSWLKTYLLEDPCYCDFLLDNPYNASAYETNIHCESLQLLSPCLEEMMLFYPNPTSGNIYLNLREVGDFKYEVYDAIGKCIKSGLVSKQRNQIDIELLQHGAYSLRLRNLSYRFIKI